MLDTLATLPPPERRVWLTGALALLATMLMAFYLESLFFRRSRRVGSWFAVRLVSLVAAPLTFAVVVLPARATVGMEGLAVFYGMLLTAGPLVWFGSHVLTGRWMRPALAGGECMMLGISGLAILSLPGVAFLMAQFPLQEAARDIARRGLPSPGSVALMHTVQPPQGFMLPGAGLVYTQSLVAAPGVRLQWVEQRQDALWPTDRNVSHPTFCTDGANVHLMWSAQEPAPYLRLHWVAPSGLEQKGEFTPDLLAAHGAATRDFTINFRPDGFDPSAPIPRPRAYLEINGAGGGSFVDTLLPRQPGETRENDCLMPGYRRVRWQEEGTVKVVGVRFYLPIGASPLLEAVFRRPAASP